MSHRWVRAGLAGAVLSAAALVSTDVLAQQIGPVPQQAGCCEGGSATGANAWTTGNYNSDQWPTTDVSPVPGWWSHGELEVGGRGFINNPARDGSLVPNANVWKQGNNLAKYYEYSDIAPGAFGGGHLATGSKDGLYQIDLWANNVGYDDQSYFLKASKAGEQYLSIGWDQSPHLYSTTAQTPFNGVGTNNLTVPARVTAAAGLGTLPLHQTDLGITRDTAFGAYRWTPTDDWDFNLDYSYLRRTGEQPTGGVIGLSNSTSGYVMVPTPVQDSTQNYGANGEYAGSSPWGQGYTLKLGYKGSQYHDDSTSYTIENPISGTTIPTARESLWPSNQANGFVGTLAADLPMKSRYVGTFNYTSMTQNSAFIPMSANFAGGATSVNPLPASGLNGQINTVLSNNVLTTKITPELTSKLTYRYYDFDNQTPQILFDQWISRDQATCCAEGAIQTLTMKYTKQDANAALNWRPSQYWNFNADYNFERYDYTQTDANATSENSAKFSADYKPFSWLTARSSASYGYRYYDIYNYIGFVNSIQLPPAGSIPPVCGPNPPGTAACPSSTFGYSSAYRQLMFDNRQRTKAQFALDVVALPNITISPTIRYQDDYYGLNPTYESGLNDSKSLSFGSDLSWTASPDLLLVFSYYREYYDISMWGATANAAPTPTTEAMTSDNTKVDTLSFGISYAAIPGKFDIDLRAAASRGVDKMLLFLSSNVTGGPTGTTGQFPEDTTWFTHLDATATYKFDPETVAKLGWKGDVKAKLRYTWEHNSVANWQNDLVVPFAATQNANALFMAADNPNYNIQMLAASLVASW